MQKRQYGTFNILSKDTGCGHLVSYSSQSVVTISAPDTAWKSLHYENLFSHSENFINAYDTRTHSIELFMKQINCVACVVRNLFFQQSYYCQVPGTLHSGLMKMNEESQSAWQMINDITLPFNRAGFTHVIYAHYIAIFTVVILQWTKSLLMTGTAKNIKKQVFHAILFLQNFSCDGSLSENVFLQAISHIW